MIKLVGMVFESIEKEVIAASAAVNMAKKDVVGQHAQIYLRLEETEAT